MRRCLFIMQTFKYAAAGHDGPMESDDGSIFYKPSLKKEVEFYTEIEKRRTNRFNKSDDGDGDTDVPFDLFLVPYYGTLDAGIVGNIDVDVIDSITLQRGLDTLEICDQKQYILLKNIVDGYKKPIVMDIKLGRVLYDEEASAEKKERMKRVSATTTSGSLGFRIAGIKIEIDRNADYSRYLLDIKNVDYKKMVNLENGNILAYNKHFGRALDEKTVIEGLKIVFRCNELPRELQDQLIETFVTRLQLLYNCLLDEEIRVISGSLLFVIEGDYDRWKELDFKDEIISDITINEEDDEIEEEKNNMLSDMKFIDFGHAKFVPGDGYDEELVVGIENLFQIIKDL